MSAQEKKMFAILKAEKPDINDPLALGGGLVLLDTEKMAEMWKNLHVSPDKKNLFKVCPVTVKFDPEKGFELQMEKDHVDAFAMALEQSKEERAKCPEPGGKDRFTKGD